MNRKNEPFYCLPWGDFHYLGPTEIVYKDNLDAIGTEANERDWLLGEANHLFPKLNLTKKVVIFTWSGVRPLTWDATLPKGNRKRVLHDLAEDGLKGVYAMTGGPLMTHRSAGTEIADAVSGYLRGDSSAAPGARFVPSYNSTFPRPEDANILGALRGDVKTPDWLLTLLKYEQVSHLSDVIMRRSGVIWYHKITDDDVKKIADNVGRLSGWSEGKVLAEIELFKKEFGVLQGIS
jgi:glycerol-3-phosphate dehydrogenase